jgi:hypothetical protein
MTSASPQVQATEGDGRADILSGYAEQSRFASANRLSTRTVARYRNRPNGLPWVEFGGRVFIPIAEACDWLKGQVRRPNIRRRS